MGLPGISVYFKKSTKDTDTKSYVYKECFYQGSEPPSDTDLIWFDDSIESIDKKLDSAIISELKSIIANMSKEQLSLKERVEYLWNNMGQEGVLPDDEYIEGYLMLEDGNYLLFETGDKIFLEKQEESSYCLVLEDGKSYLLLETGEKILLEN
jgi:hypothetical protein